MVISLGEPWRQRAGITWMQTMKELRLRNHCGGEMVRWKQQSGFNYCVKRLNGWRDVAERNKGER